MSRGLHADVVTEIAKSSINVAHLVKVTLGSIANPVIYYYTDSNQNIVESGNTYLANGFLLGLEETAESVVMSTNSIQIGVSSVNQTVIADILTNGYIDKEVTIKRAYLNADNNLVSANAVFVFYQGRIDGMSITDSNNQSTLTFNVANNFSAFLRIKSRRTTTNSQVEHYAGDKGFEFMTASNRY